MKQLNQWYLEAMYTHVKSHYGKAVVRNDGAHYQLISYNTLVAKCNHDGSDLKVYNTQSLTTLRHITDFIKQYSKRTNIGCNDDIRVLKKESE